MLFYQNFVINSLVQLFYERTKSFMEEAAVFISELIKDEYFFVNGK